jgi:hypothetical protein
LNRQIADIYLAGQLREAAPAARVASEDPAASAPRATAAAPAPIDPARLAELAGEYVSDEVGTTWRLAVDSARLVVTGGGARRTFTHRTGDQFASGSQTLRFQRDASGRVTGFLLDVGRVRNLRFTRR